MCTASSAHTIPLDLVKLNGQPSVGSEMKFATYYTEDTTCMVPGQGCCISLEAVREQQWNYDGVEKLEENSEENLHQYHFGLDLKT